MKIRYCGPIKIKQNIFGGQKHEIFIFIQMSRSVYRDNDILNNILITLYKNWIR